MGIYSKIQALSWLKAAMSKISDGEKSYQLPVKWLIANWRLWPDPDRKDEEGFQDLKALAVKKLDGIGVKYEKQYVENNIGQELGFIGEDIEIKKRPRQDEHIVMPEERLGLEEQDDDEDDYRMSEAALHRPVAQCGACSRPSLSRQSKGDL